MHCRGELMFSRLGFLLLTLFLVLSLYLLSAGGDGSIILALIVWPLSVLVDIACEHLQGLEGWSYQTRNAIESAGFVLVGSLEFYVAGWIIDRVIRRSPRKIP